MTNGIIFFKIKNNKIYIILKKNNNNKYEDFIINNNYNITDIPPLYKININDHNHKILLLNINKNISLFNNIIHESSNKINYDVVSYNSFTDDNFHKHLKTKRIKDEEISILLDKIRFNIIIRNKL
jgi:hypothetical protein